MVRNLTLAMVAAFTVLPFANKAQAVPFCDLAEQLTAEKVDPVCKAQFVSEMQNEQDKVDMGRALTLWKAPEGIEITKAGTSVFINIPGTEPLQVGFVSDDPLIVTINNKVYIDRSKEPSWSRRFEKIFAQAVKDQVVSHRVRPSWFMIERAEAFWGDLPPAPKIQAGYTFAVYNGNASTPLKGSAKDVLQAMEESDKKTPDYNGGAFSRMAHNLNPFADGPQTPTLFNKFECTENGLKSGSYRVNVGGGEQRGIVARSLGNNEVAIKGLYNDGTEIKVRMVPQSPEGVLCADRFRRGGNCSKSWEAFKSSDPEIRRLVNKATRTRRGRHRAPNCKMLGDRASECVAFFAKSSATPGSVQQQVISDDPSQVNRNTVISVCKTPDSDCKETKGNPSNKDLYNAFDPGGRSVIKAERSAAAASESLTNKQVFVNHLISAGLDEAKANSYCKTSRRGRETCSMPRKSVLKAAGSFEEADEYPQLQEELKAANAASKNVAQAASRVSSDVSSKAEDNGKALRQRAQEVAVSMLMYGTICKDKEGAKELDGWTHGSKFRNEDGSKIQ